MTSLAVLACLAGLAVLSVELSLCWLQSARAGITH